MGPSVTLARPPSWQVLTLVTTGLEAAGQLKVSNSCTTWARAAMSQAVLWLRVVELGERTPPYGFTAAAL